MTEDILAKQMQYANDKIHPVTLDEKDLTVFLCSLATLGIDGYRAIDSVLMQLVNPAKRELFNLDWQPNIYKDLSWIAETSTSPLAKYFGIGASKIIEYLLDDFGNYIELRQAVCNL